MGVRDSDLERRLKWLASQVAPVVAKCKPMVSDMQLARLLGLQLTDGDIGYAVMESEEWVSAMLDQLIGAPSPLGA